MEIYNNILLIISEEVKDMIFGTFVRSSIDMDSITSKGTNVIYSEHNLDYYL